MRVGQINANDLLPSAARIVAALASLTGVNRLSYSALRDTPFIPLRIPGEPLLYSGTLDSNNPAFVQGLFSNNLINLSGQLWVREGVSMGSASSGATVADNRTEQVYRALWGRSDVAVTGGKGVSSAADWGANKTMTLPTWAGRAMVAAGQGSGLTTRTMGTTWGSETKSLVEAELAPHAHAAGSQLRFYVRDLNSTGSTAALSSGNLVGLTQFTDTVGSGTPFSLAQPSVAAGVVLFALGVNG